jgi:hypothetical protein
MSSAALTDLLPDSAYVARAYCPGCEPDADPSLDILDVRWCQSHSPARNGADDDVVSVSAYLSGSAEAGGDDNRLVRHSAWSALARGHRPWLGAERRASAACKISPLRGDNAPEGR